MTIQDLFDPSRDIHRTIEKVISYGVSQEARLKSEISEYIVTESIEEQLEKLLSRMQAAMDAGGSNEVGVWVSGFYGSGKSSFTKYLGLAFDDQVTVEGQPFLRHLQDRLHKPQTKALLNTVTNRFPAAVLMLDLATEQIAGATLAEVSTVLYYKVLQWAGYSRNLKVAAFERKLKKDGRYDEFRELFQKTSGEPWEDYQNDELVVDSLLPRLAHQMYPALFQTEQSFNTATSDTIYLLDDRIAEILDIVRTTSGKDYIVFVIDEVGQYVGSQQNKILDLQGLTQNLKNIGDGKVWVIATAQQTLTEDDPRAAINSPELFKLKDRFPIQIDLEAHDIKEICYRRLLGKSGPGETRLGELFDKHGQALRHNTSLKHAKFYNSNFSREPFVNLYPFLPAHFDILLHLLGALAKSTGGIGLRSAIKVIQDILVEGPDGQTPVAEQPVGWLATTVTLYDALEKDIRRAFPSIYQAVDKTLQHFPESPLHQEIAKTVAVLQILNNLPTTVHNVAALMHPAVDAPSRADAVRTAVDELLSHAFVPLGENENGLRFFSEKLNDIEQERARVPLRAADTRRIFNEALREVFSPLPSARLHGTLAVTTGIKAQTGAQVSSLAGERETVQTVIEFADPQDYDTARTRLIDESRHRSSANTIYLLGRRSTEADDLVAEIYRCQRIVELHRNDPDQEVREYCASQTDRGARLLMDLQQKTGRSLSQGSFLFRGQATAVGSLSQDLLEASKKHLSTTAEQIFDHYDEAPVRAETALAEKFLRLGDLRGVTAQTDPLGLVQGGGTPSIDTGHKALVSIRDYIDRNGMVEGKRLQEHFGGPPFGWSPDTLRYLVAAHFIGGELKLKVSGRELTVNGQRAIDALKTNNTFRAVGVALRQDRPSMEVLARAAERLTELIGDQVVPLEDEIGKAATKHLPQISHRLSSLPSTLDTLNVPGAERVRSIIQGIADLLLADASDAPQRLGGEESALYDGIKWAREANNALTQDLVGTIKAVREHQQAIAGLPTTGVPGNLRSNVAEELDQASDRLTQDDFFKHEADLATALTSIQARISQAVEEMTAAQKQRLEEAERDFGLLPEWTELTHEEQSNALGQLAELSVEVEKDLSGLKRLISHDFDLQSRLAEIKRRIVADGRERQRQRAEEEKRKASPKGKRKLDRTVKVPATINSVEALDELIRELQALKIDIGFWEEFELRFSQE